MTFKKGRTPWNKGLIGVKTNDKGRKLTEEHKKKLSISKIGNTYWKGKHHSKETKKKISEANKGNKNHLGIKHSNETKRKMRKKHWSKKEGYVNHWIGRKHSNKTKNKISKTRKRKKVAKKENNPNWQGGITLINFKIRNSLEYKLWRKAVLERDNYACVWCGNKEKLEVDHIKPFALFPELRFAIDNGRTLCRSCHEKTNTYGGKIR